jgi:hypothetical protein
MEVRKTILNTGPTAEESKATERAFENDSHLAEGISGIADCIENALAQPEWTDHNSHDPGITLTELLAYSTDQLSYEQDQVADESYLETKREADPKRKVDP